MNPFFGGAKGEGFRINARIYMETNFSLSYALKLVCREMSGAAIGGVLPRACMWYMRSRSEHKISHYQVYVYYLHSCSLSSIYCTCSCYLSLLSICSSCRDFFYVTGAPDMTWLLFGFAFFWGGCHRHAPKQFMTYWHKLSPTLDIKFSGENTKPCYPSVLSNTFPLTPC